MTMISVMQNGELRPFEQQLAASWPPSQWRDLGVVLAISGGADSVGLFRGMASLRGHFAESGRLIVAHLNHHLQPQADEVAKFVASLAGQFDVPFELGEADVASLAARGGNGIEAAAREARYAFLQNVAERRGVRYVATAHTADDQVETVLFNFLRGTGLSGLSGMRRARPLGKAVSLIRPLLSFRRAQVLNYLDETRQEFHHDPSNFTTDYTRNRLRLELLPLLRRDFNPAIDDAVFRIAQLAGDAQRTIAGLADNLLDRCLRPGIATPGLEACVLNTLPLATAEHHLVREMFVVLWRRLDWPLQKMGFAEWDRLAAVAMAHPEPATNTSTDQHQVRPGKCNFPGGVLIERDDCEMRLIRQRPL